MVQNFNLIIDFDSTFVKLEALEELAKISLKDNPKSEKLINEIRKITNLGMEGKITFSDSLSRRFKMLAITLDHIRQLLDKLQDSVTDSIIRNKGFFKNNANNIYIITGGFKNFVIPITNPFGIPEKNILANEFEFDDRGNITGFNQSNPLARANGKTKQVQALNLKRPIIVIGDGWSDYQIREAGVADKFIAFTENVRRENVIARADFIANDFEAVSNFLDNEL